MSHHELTQIGKYHIEDLIGEGAMGVVYRALDPVLNRRVAIKVMGDALARDGELRDRFLREARAAGSLQHPNVITIYDFGEVDGHLYIAMEYIEGIDLEDLLRSGTPLSLDAKLSIMIDVLNGLAYAHKRGVVHRDIKPANIRVDDEGHARIMDFGIARLNSGAMTKMTRTGVMLGTPNYMAPEQIVGEEITSRTDIFAAGAVLYELLTNARPFQAETLHAVLYKITSEAPQPLDKLLPGLPSALNGIVMKALAKEPGQRWANALEMANEIARVRMALGAAAPASMSLHATIEQARLSGSTLRAQAHVRRRFLYAGGGVGVAAVALVLWIVLSPQGVRGGPAAAASVTPQGGTTAVADSSATRRADTANLRVPNPAPTSSSGAAPAVAAANAAAVADSMRALARSVHEKAVMSRQRAVSAGARSAQLQAGDDHERRGDEALRDGQFTRASDHYSRAAAAWFEAERNVRAVAAADAARESRLQSAPQNAAATVSPPPVSVPVQTPVTQSQTTQTQPVQTPSIQTPPPVTAPQPPVSATAEITAVIAQYARAIESRDMAEIKRVYPAITRDQQRGFEQFFSSVRSLRANFTVSSVNVEGASAEARLEGTYEYVTSQGREQRQAVAFQATLRKDAASWRLATVR
jgi:eukaryotic-like serine/threonine-protein kinase